MILVEYLQNEWMMRIKGRLQGGLQGLIDTRIYQRKKKQARAPKARGPKGRHEARTPKITNTQICVCQATGEMKLLRQTNISSCHWILSEKYTPHCVVIFRCLINGGSAY